MITKLLENIAWTLCFVAGLCVCVFGTSKVGIWLEERIGTFWALTIIIFLTAIIFNVVLILISGGFHG